MTMADRSPVKTALRKKAASVRDLDEAEYRGVMNTAYNDEVDGVGKGTQNGGTWFMVKNPEFIEHKVDFMKEVKDAPWYYGRISRERAEDILNDNLPVGTYIVRSGQRDTEFYLSVRAPEGGPKVRHIEIDRYEDDFVAVLGNAEDAMGFATFEKLIEYLKSTPIHFEGCQNDLLLTDYVDRLGITVL